MFMICDGHSNQLADGIQTEGEARKIAQSYANTLRETVFAYGPADSDFFGVDPETTAHYLGTNELGEHIYSSSGAQPASVKYIDRDGNYVSDK